MSVGLINCGTTNLVVLRLDERRYELAGELSAGLVFDERADVERLHAELILHLKLVEDFMEVVLLEEAEEGQRFNTLRKYDQQACTGVIILLINLMINMDG